MVSNDNFIIKDKIRSIYKEYCKVIKIKFHKVEFENFLDFLEIDLYDWVEGNLKYFNFENSKQKQHS